MNISATGSSSLSALYLQQLLSSSSTTALSDSSSDDSSSTDLLTLSLAGQQAAATQGSDPFTTDLKSLESSISSGDLATAKKTYEAMTAKMKEHGDIPSDFAAIGKALDSGDQTAASTAMDTVKKNAGSHRPPPPPSGGANALKDDMDQLSSLISSGDLSGASTLFSSILGKAQGLSSSSSSSSDSLSSAASDLSSALTSGDSSSSATALEKLLAELQARQGNLASSYTKSMESVASSAYVTAAAAI